MPIFKYKATNKERATVSGLVEAQDEGTAINILHDNDLEILSLDFDSAGGKKFSIVLDKIKAKDLVIFSRQFSVLVAANVPLVESLKILVNQTENIKLKMVISEIADDIDEGSRLSDALTKKSKVFSNFYISVVRSGETSGKLDEVLDYLADQLEKDYDMTSKIKGAMIYPVFVLGILGAVGVAMMIFVVPQLTDVITETGGELPLATKILIATSDFLKSFWWILLAVIIGIITGFKYLLTVPAAKNVIDALTLRLPIFGKLFQRIYLVRFTRSLQTLIIGGVSISKALAITAEIASNSVYKNLILETKKSVEDGNSISSVFETSDVIPKMVTQMMSIGEKTGKLDTILEKITDFYNKEVNNIVANLMTLMEPVIMVVLGVGVAVMVMAIMVPMYNMAGSM